MIEQRVLLAGCGRALYGPNQPWQSALARDLGVSDRTVRRWISGDSAMSARARDALLELVTARYVALSLARTAIKSGVPLVEWRDQ